MYKSNKGLVLFLPLIIILAVLCQTRDNPSVQYVHFSGESSTLGLLRGREVAMYYPLGQYQRDSLALLLETYDRAYALAVEVSGREPSSRGRHADLLPVAVVRTTCGPGCGRLGAKGIEVTEAKFTQIYAAFSVGGIHDHLYFYELGRNFWFYGEESSDREWEAIHTGFAVFFRDFLIRELKLTVPPINGVAYSDYMDAKQGQWQRFRKESLGLAWEEVQQIKAVQFPHAPLFWSSLWWELYSEHGRDGVESTLAWLGEQAAPGGPEDWYGYLDDSNQCIPLSKCR